MEQLFSGHGIRTGIAKTSERFLDSLELTWITLKPNTRWIAIFGLVTHPLFLFVNNELGNGEDSIGLRILAFFACLLAIFLHQIERAQGIRVASWLAVILIFFTLPFFFLWVLADNSLNDKIGATELASRQIQCAFAIMATALLIYDRVVLITGLAICFLIVGLLVYSNSGGDDLSSVREGFLTQVPFWIFGIIAGSYFNRNRVVVEREKFKTLSDTGGYLAHELRTPLAGISLKLHGLNHFLHEKKKLVSLDDGFEEADVSLILDAVLDKTASLSSAAIEDVVYANELIDMFLVRARVTSSTVETKIRFHASTCVEEAFGRYPFASARERESTRVFLENDFEIVGPKLLVVHVVLNLLKNALAYAPSSPDSEVVIRVYQDGGYGCIDVKDNGPGIAVSDQSKIFDSFYTTTLAGEGAGIGLHFCKSVISEMGGELTVNSVPNVETVFSIKTQIPDS